MKQLSITIGVIMMGFMACEEENLFSPLVDTLEAEAITSNSATLVGDLIELGSFPVVDHGFEYSTDSTDTVSGRAEAKLSLGATSTLGEFRSTITDLDEGTTYFFRAFAEGEESTGYGFVQSFTTP